MKKREWLIVLLPLIISWGFDRLTKFFAAGIVGIHSFGPVNLVLHHNHGAMLGMFSDLPTILRIVSLSTGGAFLIFTYAIVQYLLPIRSLMLRSGLSVLLGGIIGNVTDRIIYSGYVVDFIVIKFGNMLSPAFNMADFLQWIGYILIVYALIRESESIWPTKNMRKNYWVNPKFQIRYCLILVNVGLGLALIGGIFSYTYLRVTISELIGNYPHVSNRFLTPYIITYVMISIAFAAISFLIGKIISHRIAGPLYAFEKFLADTLDGKQRLLKLRAGDDFRHLEELSEQILTQISNLKAEANKNKSKDETEQAG